MSSKHCIRCGEYHLFLVLNEFGLQTNRDKYRRSKSSAAVQKQVLLYRIILAHLVIDSKAFPIYSEERRSVDSFHTAF